MLVAFFGEGKIYVVRKRWYMHTTVRIFSKWAACTSVKASINPPSHHHRIESESLLNWHVAQNEDTVIWKIRFRKEFPTIPWSHIDSYAAVMSSDLAQVEGMFNVFMSWTSEKRPKQKSCFPVGNRKYLFCHWDNSRLDDSLEQL